MKASVCMMSAGVVVCLAHAAALAQYGGAPKLWGASGRSVVGNPSDSPFDPNSPGGVRNPFDPPSSGEWKSPLGSYRPVPPEPRTSDVLKQNDNPKPATSAPISEEQLAQLANVGKIDLNIPPTTTTLRPRPAPYEPPAAASWQGWGWLAAAAGVLVLGLLAVLMRARVGRKPMPR